MKLTINRLSLIVALLLISVGSYGQNTWTATAGPFGGDVDNIKRASDGTLYAVVGRKLYRSTNNADSWSAVVPTTPTSFFLNDILIDSDGVLYAVYFSSFYKSTDNGVNWTLVNSNLIQSGYYIITAGPDNVFVVWGSGGLYVSIDKGTSWTQLSNQGWSGTPGCWTNSAGDLFYGIQGGKILRHTYQGLTSNWSSTNVEELTNYEVSSGDVNVTTITFDAGGRMYVASFFDVFISDNNGDTYTSITANLNAPGVDLFYFDGLLTRFPDNNVYFFASTDDRLYKTTDQGANWTVSDGPSKDYGTNVRSIVYASASTFFTGTDGDGVFRTTDAGINWQFKSTGLTGTNASGIVVTNTNRIILIKNAGSYWSSTNGGSTWQINVTNDYINGGLKLSDGTIILYGSKVFRSTDNGANFIDDGNYYSDYKIIEAANGDLYGFRNGKISRSTDEGANWNDLAITGLPVNFQPYQAALDDSNNILCHGWDGVSAYKLFKVIGTTATDITADVPLVGTSVNNLFHLNGKFYISQFSSYFYTSDIGDNWTTVGFSGDKVLPLSNGSFNGVAVSKSGSLSITQDEGNTWNTTLPPTGAVITDIATDTNGDFYASANQSSVLKYTNELLVDPVTLPPYIDFDWQPLNGPSGGNIRRLVAHPDGTTLFAIANGFFLWRYKDGVWSRLTPISGVTTIFDIAIDATGNVYLAPSKSPQKIYVSGDKGDTWNPTTSTGLPTGVPIRMIEILSDGSFLAFGNSGGFGRIYKSTDLGGSFTEKYTSAENVLFNLLPLLPAKRLGNVAAMGHKLAGSISIPNEGLLVSSNFGDTWTAKSLSTIASTTGFIGSFVYDNQGALLATSIIDSTIPNWVTNVSKSNNNGDTWNNVTTPGPTTSLPYGKRLVILPDDTYLLTLQNPFFDLYKSTDHGANWNYVNKIGDIFLTTASQGSNVYVGGNIKGVQKTIDGSTFTEINNGMPTNFSNDIEVLDNTHLIIGATSPYYSSDFGQTLSLASPEVAGNFLLTEDAIIGYGSKNLQRSTNGGISWTAIGDDRYFNYLTADIAGNGYYAFSNSEIPGTTVEFGLFFSTDLLSWTEIELSGLPENFTVNGMVIDAGGVIYALIFNQDEQSQKIYKIVFGSAVEISNDIGVNSPTGIKYFNGKILVYDATGKLFKSTDGLTWTQGSAPAGNLLITANDYLFISAINTVLWLSRDEGLSWQSVGDAPLSSVLFRDIAINEYDGYAYAAMTGDFAKKSNNIVIPDDGNEPVALTLSPTPGATGVVALPTLTITFDEATNKVSNKKIRIFDLSQPALPVHVLDASAGVRNGRSYSFTLPADLGYLKTYFVVIDPDAFLDIHGNGYVGISANTTWRFTIQEEPDTQAPSITVTTTAFNLEKGTAKVFDVQVTDNKILPTDKTTLKYRGIAKLESVAFSSAPMAVVTGGGTTSASFNLTLQESWFDEMGLEFYFESEDASGNVQRSPAAPGTYLYSYIEYPSGVSPVVPAGRVAFGGTESSYRIVSMPFELEDPQVTTILDELGAYDKTKWRMYTYAGNNQFTENPSTFERGRGYWINVRNAPGNLTIDGASTPANNRTNFFTIDLSPGWNQIGNPYPVDISWEQTRAADATVGVLKTYSGTTYANGDVLSPYQGGFVFVDGSSPVSLKVRFRDILSGGRVQNFNSDLSQPNWVVPISAIGNEITNSFGGIGMHQEASINWDQFDDLNPPRFLDYAEVQFDRFGDFKIALDVVPSAEEFEWDFVVNSSEGITSLSWNYESIVGDKELVLMDVEKQYLVDMTNEGMYSFQSQNSHRFKIYYGVDLKSKIKPTAVTLGKAYPNPASNLSSIQYTIPEGKSIYTGSLEVYDIMGRKISVITSGHFTPGFHSATWNTDNNQNGLYFYKLNVHGGGKSYSLTERIILNR